MSARCKYHRTCSVNLKRTRRVWLLCALVFVRVWAFLASPDMYGHLMRLCLYVYGYWQSDWTRMVAWCAVLCSRLVICKSTGHVRAHDAIVFVRIWVLTKWPDVYGYMVRLCVYVSGHFLHDQTCTDAWCECVRSCLGTDQVTGHIRSRVSKELIHVWLGFCVTRHVFAC